MKKLLVILADITISILSFKKDIGTPVPTTSRLKQVFSSIPDNG